MRVGENFTLSFIRSFFLIISGTLGYYIGNLVGSPLYGIATGCLCGLLLIFMEMRLRRVSVRGLSSMVFGLLLGILMAKLISDIMLLLPINVFFHSISRVVLTVAFSYLGAVTALRGKDEFNLIIPYVRFKRQDDHEGVILLDTSAIIDGRINEIYKTHFLSGALVVPRFVLKELQTISDSENDLKRQKGRRGIENLRNMQHDVKLDVRIHEDDLTGEQDVDAKLISLAKLMDAKICTTDFNLSRVATIQGINALNINELASAVKSALHVGDELNIRLIKEGKESSQALGYLEDGTMIVVSDAKDKIGEDVNITVTSVLQTQAGKMIFAKLG